MIYLNGFISWETFFQKSLQSDCLSAVRFIHESQCFALNRIFFSANENGPVKQNKESDFKVSSRLTIKFQENESKSHFVANFATIIAKILLLVFFLKLTNLINYSF